jgi:hypothetical protein
LEDVACRVIAAHQRPDHATIARFVVRQERSLGKLFGEVLGLTARQYDSVPATSVWLMPVFVLKVPVKV